MSDLEKPRASEEEVNVAHEQHSPERRALEKKLVRKIDMRMSILIVIYILNYDSRGIFHSFSARAARKRGLERDLHLTGEQFPTLLSVIGYIIMQIPSNMFLNTIGRPSIYLPGCMIIWGTISCLTGVTKNFVGALLTRFFLGFVEAAFFPCSTLLQWYKRDEIGLRTAILYCGNIISNAFGSLMASGILANMDGKLGHAAWRWLFYIGSFDNFHRNRCHFCPARLPHHVQMVVTRERELALLRMEEDAGVGDQDETEQGGPLHGLYLAVTDWRVWWLAFALTSQVVALSFNAFFPTLTATLGFSPTVTLLLCAPPFAVSAAAAFLLARYSSQVGERCFHMNLSFGLGIVGFIISISTMNTAARYVSFFLQAQQYAGFVVLYAWMSNTFARPPSKRAVALALINAWSQLGNVAGEYVWPSNWGPTYHNSYAICIACSGTTMVMCFIFRLVLVSENKRLDKEEEEQGVKTKGFRYIL
ncbi:MFS general substrate transporter [Roridomyces roridus]|uniref:MFS general substrate transporter n=1 Tax=Roridomyces roridus TaxID=1738132 RepID=A0AAD7C4J5_9AGAR|nr:MFS general substrate transporter [Roridomyces roridus]